MARTAFSGIDLGNATAKSLKITRQTGDTNAALTIDGVDTPALTVSAGTAGTATASKAVVLDSNKAIDAVRTSILAVGASGSEKKVPTNASLSYGSETSHARVVTITLKDSAGNAVDAANVVRVYLSDASTGIGITGTACTSEATVATNGALLLVDATDSMWTVVSSTAGVITMTLTQTAAVNYYPVVVLPVGRIVVGSVLAFAG